MPSVNLCRIFFFKFAVQQHKDSDIQNYNFAFVLYGCETWLLTLREECGLWVLENRVLRRIFGPKRDEVKGELRKQHNEELNDLHSSLDIIWMMKSRIVRWAGHVACMGDRCMLGFGGET